MAVVSSTRILSVYTPTDKLNWTDPPHTPADQRTRAPSLLTGARAIYTSTGDICILHYTHLGRVHVYVYTAHKKSVLLSER